MRSNTFCFCFLVLMISGLGGCSSGPSAKESAKASPALDKITGKAQVLEETTSTDAALNAGGPSVYLWEGLHRYRLFLNKPVEVVHGKMYVAEGIYAQKAIDEIGDPDQGKHGYPLTSSCERVVKRAWGGLAFDVIDGDVSVLRARVQRFPARPIFLVTRLEPAPGESKEEDPEDQEKKIPEISVAADKQRALLIEGPAAQTAPLWEPAGGPVRCKVVINPEGKVTGLETWTQLCEAVPWSQFRYQSPVQGGHPVKVKTEVEVNFEPRK